MVQWEASGGFGVACAILEREWHLNRAGSVRRSPKKSWSCPFRYSRVGAAGGNANLEQIWTNIGLYWRVLAISVPEFTFWTESVPLGGQAAIAGH